MKKGMVRLDDLSLDPRLQMRVSISGKTAAKYAQQLEQMPPVKCVRDEDGKLFPWDGWHTITAAKLNKAEEVCCEWQNGTFYDAMELAAGANDTHGLPRTNADKRKAIETLLKEEHYQQCSDNLIAEYCKVSNHLVAEVRANLENSNQHSSSGRPTTSGARKGKDGKKRAASVKVLCNRCKRMGIQVRNCKACKEATVEAKKRDKRKGKEKPRQVTDQFGNIVPNNLLILWNDSWVQDAIDTLEEVAEQIRKSGIADKIAEREPFYPFIGPERLGLLGSIPGTLDRIAMTIREQRYAGVCPKCSGERCQVCQDIGLLPKETYEKVIAKVEF